jgi:hypothetical protein
MQHRALMRVVEAQQARSHARCRSGTSSRQPLIVSVVEAEQRANDARWSALLSFWRDDGDNKPDHGEQVCYPRCASQVLLVGNGTAQASQTRRETPWRKPLHGVFGKFNEKVVEGAARHPFPLRCVVSARRGPLPLPLALRFWRVAFGVGVEPWRRKPDSITGRLTCQSH